MTDNVEITKNANSTPPHGTIIATDDVDGKHYQRFKLDVGGDGVSVLLKVNGNGEPVVITHRENAIHEGRHWYIEGFVTLGNNAGVDDTLYVKMVTPASSEIHLTWNVDAGGILETNFYEGASGGMADGNAATPLNNLRTSEDVSEMVITQDVTVATTKGTKIASKKVGGTGFKTVSGGDADRAGELVLKPSTTYFREFISTSADNIISFKAKWIEGE